MRLPSMAARACLVLALVGFGVASHPRASQGEDVLTNQDVVKMVGAKLGDEVIVAKIREAPRADFQLSVDDLVGLRNAGVSEQVIHAMLERNRPERPRPARPTRSEGEVSLKTSGGSIPLHLAIGEVSSAGMGPFTNVFMNYPGLRSQVRTGDRRPTLLVSCPSGPEVGHYYIAKLDPDRRHAVRSVKIGKGVRRVTHEGGRFAPDEDWIIPYDVKTEAPGSWTVTPQRDLPPGEYGFYINMETTLGGQVAVEGITTTTPQQTCFRGGVIYDFGID